MRTALISDIHGNIGGLRAALNDIKKQGCSRVICLGDLVDGGPANEAVVNEIVKKEIICVRGNHDEVNDLRLSAETDEILNSLPEEIIEDDIVFTHISPRLRKKKIDSDIEAWNVFDETSYRLIFIGHVHVPLIFGANSDQPVSSKRHSFNYNEPFPLDIDDRYVICVGSIGYGRDLVGKLRYGIYDDVNNSIEIRAIPGPLLPIDWKIRLTQLIDSSHTSKFKN